MERNKRNKKQNISFSEYCELIEELLKLTGRKIKKRPAIKPDGFIL
jgi:hypothetical protein